MHYHPLSSCGQWGCFYLWLRFHICLSSRAEFLTAHRCLIRMIHHVIWTVGDKDISKLLFLSHPHTMEKDHNRGWNEMPDLVNLQSNDSVYGILWLSLLNHIEWSIIWIISYGFAGRFNVKCLCAWITLLCILRYLLCEIPFKIVLISCIFSDGMFTENLLQSRTSLNGNE
jgi:hypothetical protein